MVQMPTALHHTPLKIKAAESVPFMKEQATKLWLLGYETAPINATGGPSRVGMEQKRLIMAGFSCLVLGLLQPGLVCVLVALQSP
jgi:hypothetical protein